MPFEIDPSASPTWLGDEVVEDTAEREELLEEKAATLGKVNRVLELFSMPGWELLREELQKHLQDATNGLVGMPTVHDPQADALHRGRITELNWILGQPEDLAQKRATLRSEITVLEAPPEEEGQEE